MKTFVAASPEIKVGTLLMKGMLDGIDPDKLSVLFEKYGIPSNFQDGDFYYLQPYLDVMRDLSGGSVRGMFDFVAIGMRIVDNTPFPPEVDDIVGGFAFMNEAYHANLEGESEDEGWRTKVVDENYIVARQVSPFPSDLEYGVAYGIVKKFRPEDKEFTVELEELPDEDWEFHIHLE